MKKTIIFNMLLLLILAACSEREKITVGVIVNPVLSSNVANADIIIEETTLESLFDTFRWTQASFGFQSASPEYFLWLDIAGNNFTDAVSLGSTKELELAITNARVNQLLITMGATPNAPVDVEFRLTGGIHDSLNTLSNSITVSITPLKVIPVFPKLYVTGDNNAWGFNENALLYSVKSNNVYEGYIYFDNGANWSKFKLSYQPDWNSADAIVGDPDAGGVSNILQVGNWGGNNINVTAGTGYYKLIANINSLSYSVTKTDWGITGDFNGWANAPMTYDAATETWTITTDFTVGGFKFIANYDWSLVYGDDELDKYLEPGTNGNNIQITEAGNYTVNLDLSQALYTYTVSKN